MSGEPASKKVRVEEAAEAVRAGDAKRLRCILDDPNCPDNSEEWLGAVGEGTDQLGWNVLHLAAAHDKVECIDLLIEKFPKLASMPADLAKRTPLLLAIEKEKELLTIEALLKGAGQKVVNDAGSFGTSPPLWTAFFTKRPDNYAYLLSKLLIDHGATYDSGYLRGAIRGKNLEVVKLMIELGCRANTPYPNDNYHKEFPLYTAAEVGSLPILKLILQQAPSMINAKTRGELGQTALVAACTAGHADCVLELLAAGANPNPVGRDGSCALTSAAASGRVEVVKVLLQQKSVKATASKMSNWRSELHPITNAIPSGSAETVRLLVNSKFCRYDLTSDNEECMPAELIDEFCIEWGYLGCISYALNEMSNEVEPMVYALLDAGYHVNTDTVPPLSVAVMQMDSTVLDHVQMMERIIRRLLEEGANLNYITHSSHLNTNKKICAPDALVLAVQTKNVKTMRLLLQYWAPAPAELLVTYDKHDDVSPLKLDTWFPVLVEYGLPHGKPFMAELKRKLENCCKDQVKKDGVVLAKEIASDFIKQLETPSTLKQLARFAVREVWGKEASKEDQTLYTALNELQNLPETVKSFLLMEVP